MALFALSVASFYGTWANWGVLSVLAVIVALYISTAEITKHIFYRLVKM